MIIKKEIPILKFFLLGLEYIGFISHDNNIFFNLTSKPLYVSSEFGNFVLEPSRYCDGDVKLDFGGYSICHQGLIIQPVKELEK